MTDTNEEVKDVVVDEKPKTAKQISDEKAKAKASEVFVSKEEFNGLKDEMKSSFSELINLIKQKPEEKTKTEAKDKQINEAGSDMADVNPRYDAKAREVLGEKLDRTYVKYPKGGGTLFTIVVKKEFSNSPESYLNVMKEDHRTVNIEREEFRGEDGVEKWAKLVLANLNKAKN